MEIQSIKGFRNIKANWAGFENDILPTDCLDVDRKKLMTLLEQYFIKQGLACDWAAVKDAPEDRLMTCLAMVCPFEPEEKQALLEAKCCGERAELFMTMLDMAVKADDFSDIKH